MYLSNSFGIVNKSVAVVVCFSLNFSNSSTYSLDLAAAIVVAFIKQSVTFGSDFVITPIADTTANVWFPRFALSMSKSHTPDILSEEPTQVPPNLCTFHPASAPLGKVLTFSSGNESTNACTSAGKACEMTRRLFLFLSPPAGFVVAFLDDDDDDDVTIFPLVFFRHDSNAVDDDALIKITRDDIIYARSKKFFSSLSYLLLSLSLSSIHSSRECGRNLWSDAKTSKHRYQKRMRHFGTQKRKKITMIFLHASVVYLSQREISQKIHAKNKTHS